MIGQSSRWLSRSARSIVGRIRSKKYSRREGSSPVNGSPCATIDRAMPVFGSVYQKRSCSIATGVPVAIARSTRSAQRPS
jgi:hypothetical protein